MTTKVSNYSISVLSLVLAFFLSSSLTVSSISINNGLWASTDEGGGDGDTGSDDGGGGDGGDEQQTDEPSSEDEGEDQQGDEELGDGTGDISPEETPQDEVVTDEPLEDMMGEMAPMSGGVPPTTPPPTAPITCPEKHTLIGGTCVPTAPEPECQPGEMMVLGNCVPLSTIQSLGAPPTTLAPTTPSSDGTTPTTTDSGDNVQTDKQLQPSTTENNKPNDGEGGTDGGTGSSEDQKKTDGDPAIDLLFGGSSGQQDSTPAPVTKTGPKTETLPDGTTITTYPDSRKTTTKTDGTIISEMPDGSKTTLIPVKGSTPDKPLGYTRVETDRWGITTTTTHPDGTRIWENVGITHTTKPDGTIIYQNQYSGETSTFYKNGLWIKKLPNGETMTKELRVDGPYITKYANGDIKKEYDDGSSLITKTDGTLITKNIDGKQVTEKPEGSVTTENPDGTWYIMFPKNADGSQKTYNSDGTEVCKDAGGKVTPCK